MIPSLAKPAAWSGKGAALWTVKAPPGQGLRSPVAAQTQVDGRTARGGAGGWHGSGGRGEPVARRRGAGGGDGWWRRLGCGSLGCR